MEALENISLEYAFLTMGLLFLTTACIGLIMFLRLIKLERRVKNMLGGHSTGTIESSLDSIQKKLEQHEKIHNKANEHLGSLERRVSGSIQGVETLRFNPFKGNGGGGNQSFATSLIDGDGNGVVISSLYSRERVSIYAKPINSFASEHTLSDEEKEVLTKSRKRMEARHRERSI